MVYPSTFERKVNLSKASFTKLRDEYRQLRRAQEDENHSDDKVTLTATQCAAVTTFERTGQRYISIYYEKEDEGEMVIDTSRTINLNGEEAAKLEKAIDDVYEAITYAKAAEGSNAKMADAKIHCFCVLHVDDEIEDKELPEAIFFTEEEADEFENATTDDPRVVREVNLPRPGLGDMADALFDKELGRLGPRKGVNDRWHQFRDMDRSQLSVIMRKMLQMLKYPEPLFAAEIIDLYFDVCGYFVVGGSRYTRTGSADVDNMYRTCLATATYDAVAKQMGMKPYPGPQDSDDTDGEDEAHPIMESQAM